MELRPYQKLVLDKLIDYLACPDYGNPVVVMPTGSGKSVVIAELCRSLCATPNTRILMLTHVKELIEQNLDKLYRVWPEAPVGVFSAGLGRKEIAPITFAGIQSLARSTVTTFDYIIIDECHRVDHEKGGYRLVINAIKSINPKVVVIGFTATPWRTGHGLITEGKRGDNLIFGHLINEVSIADLILKKYLATPINKVGSYVYDTSKVKTELGDYKTSELQAAVDTEQQTVRIVSEIIARSEERKHWLVFCVGVAHAINVTTELLKNGIAADYVIGGTPSKERAEIIQYFRDGQLQALVNANVLTTGFDAPNVDYLVLLRPTQSAVLYAQMVGRGMRPKEHCDNVLLLDFGANILRHGPIDDINPPGAYVSRYCDCPACYSVIKEGLRLCPLCGHEFFENNDDESEGKKKSCPSCKALVYERLQSCTKCGYVFVGLDATEGDPLKGEKNEKKNLVVDADVYGWQWKAHLSQSGNLTIRITYQLNLTRVNEYLSIFASGYALTKARRRYKAIHEAFKQVEGFGLVDVPNITPENIDQVCALISGVPAPKRIKYSPEGKFFDVLAVSW
jgi:DNA repair protein RadD